MNHDVLELVDSATGQRRVRAGQRRPDQSTTVNVTVVRGVAGTHGDDARVGDGHRPST